MDWMQETAAQLPKGAFLMVNGNPMTIGWGQFGVIWGKRTFTVYVRKSRYTHALLENATTFTVSVPFEDTYREALALCGTKSGRDIDKMKTLGAEFFEARYGGQNGFAGCRYQIECRILSRSDLDENTIEEESLLRRYYPNGDSHTMYIGEILGVTEASE